VNVRLVGMLVCVHVCVFRAHDMRVCLFRAHDMRVYVFCTHDMRAGVFRAHYMRSPPNYAYIVKVKTFIHDLLRHNVWLYVCSPSEL
jgi:hypothetical protein